MTIVDLGFQELLRDSFESALLYEPASEMKIKVCIILQNFLSDWSKIQEEELRKVLEKEERNDKDEEVVNLEEVILEVCQEKLASNGGFALPFYLIAL